MIQRLADIALREFADIVLSATVGDARLRLYFADGSYVVGRQEDS